MTDSSKSKPIRQSGSHYLTDANDELASLLGELENLDLNEAVSEPELSTTPAAAPPRPVAAPPRPVVAPVRGPAESVPDLPSGRRIAQLEAELEALRDKSQRAAGDFANYRKRLKKERDDAVEFANEKVFKDLLTVVDSFQLAVKHASTSNSDSIVNGVKMIYQQMLGTLGRHGMQPFQSVDAAFDPRLHQAVSRVVRGDVVPGTVVSTAQQGFTLKGRLLRPALVSVAVAKDGDAAPARLTGDPVSQPEIPIAEMTRAAAQPPSKSPRPARAVVTPLPKGEAPRPETRQAQPVAPDDDDPLAELEQALLEAASATKEPKPSTKSAAPAKQAAPADDWDDEWDDGIDAFFDEIAKSDE